MGEIKGERFLTEPRLVIEQDGRRVRFWAGWSSYEGFDDLAYDVTVHLRPNEERVAHDVERLELRQKPGGPAITVRGIARANLGVAIEDVRTRLTAKIANTKTRRLSERPRNAPRLTSEDDERTAAAWWRLQRAEKYSTAAIAAELGVSPDVARSRVRRCRDPKKYDPPLIPPASSTRPQRPAE